MRFRDDIYVCGYVLDIHHGLNKLYWMNKMHVYVFMYHIIRFWTISSPHKMVIMCGYVVICKWFYIYNIKHG